MPVDRGTQHFLMVVSYGADLVLWVVHGGDLQLTCAVSMP